MEENSKIGPNTFKRNHVQCYFCFIFWAHPFLSILCPEPWIRGVFRWLHVIKSRPTSRTKLHVVARLSISFNLLKVASLTTWYWFHKWWSGLSPWFPGDAGSWPGSDRKAPCAPPGQCDTAPYFFGRRTSSRSNWLWSESWSPADSSRGSGRSR